MKNYLKRFIKHFFGIIGVLICIGLAGAVVGGLGSIIEFKFGSGWSLAYGLFFLLCIISGILAIEPKS